MLRKNLFIGSLVGMGLFATSENSGALSSIVVVEGDSIAKANPQIYLEYLRKHVHFEKNIHQTTINSERHQSFLKSKVLSGFTANNSKSKLITRQLASLSYTGNINTFLSLRGGDTPTQSQIGTICAAFFTSCIV